MQDALMHHRGDFKIVLLQEKNKKEIPIGHGMPISPNLIRSAPHAPHKPSFLLNGVNKNSRDK
ncbi:hypothetical protein GJ744_002310 [Endocarpon pusillum]|uniref:Uncharacterized protein n=1 Tax=Endocarpon pusillum TaxID=364733 RepID=A0A8H7AN51_9EURO|nr:hypothetical protein GJ744_002310 [Endocarpon pusillum]